MRTRVKICGVTRPEDALLAAAYGADAIGVVFYAKSPRGVDVVQAQRIVASLPPFVSAVGLFVDAPPEEVEGILKVLPLDVLQFHGREPPEYCRQFGRPYIKAIPGEGDIRDYAETYREASALLLDSHAFGEAGGTGKPFAWSRPPEVGKPLILAGGLNPENVAEAIERVRPYGVDVSSGVEARKGVKDSQKMAAFMEAVFKRG